MRYMAENFASFDYKTQEEVLTVLKYLTSILSTTGSQIVEALSPSHLLAQLHDNSPNVNAVPPIEGQIPVGSALVALVPESGARTHHISVMPSSLTSSSVS